MSTFEYTNTPDAPSAIGPYSQAIRFNDLLFSSGQIPLDPKTMEVVGDDVTAQTKQVLSNIEGVLKANGLDAHAVIKTTCFLHDMADFAAFNDVYKDFFVSKPARSCVAVKTLPKDVLCEIEFIAVFK